MKTITKIIYIFLIMIFLFNVAYAEVEIKHLQMNDQGTETYSQMYSIDYKFSMFMGADLITNVWHSYMFYDDKIVPTLFNRDDFLGVLLRSGKIVISHYPLANLLGSFQHEIFGHGARLREHDVNVTRYEFYFPSMGAKTVWSTDGYNKKGIFIRSAIRTGGIEARKVLASKLVEDWLLKQKMDARESVLYLMNNLEQLRQIYTNNYNTTDHDIGSYIANLNPYLKAPLTENSLRKYVLVDLLEPFNALSIYNILKYAVKGENTTELYMLEVGEAVRYLPGMRIILAPYGLEYQLMNYIIWQDKSAIIGLKIGNNNNTTFGVDAVINNLLIHEDLSFGVKTSIWVQPELYNVNDTSSQTGGLFAIRVKWQRENDVNNWGLFAEAGYKGIGFTLGEKLDNGFIGKIGILFSL